MTLLRRLAPAIAATLSAGCQTTTPQQSNTFPSATLADKRESSLLRYTCNQIHIDKSTYFGNFYDTSNRTIIVTTQHITLEEKIAPILNKELIIVKKQDFTESWAPIGDPYLVVPGFIKERGHDDKGRPYADVMPIPSNAQESLSYLLKRRRFCDPLDIRYWSK